MLAGKLGTKYENRAYNLLAYLFAYKKSEDILTCIDHIKNIAIRNRVLDEAIEKLCKSKKASYSIVHNELIEKLCNSGKENAVNVLARLLDMKREQKVYYNTKLKMSACTALGKLGIDTVIDPLIKALKDTSHLSYEESVRSTAASALGEFHNRIAVEALIAALNDDDKYDFRERVVAALGKIGDEKAIKPLIDVLITDNKIALQIINSLDNININWRLLDISKTSIPVLLFITKAAAGENGISKYFGIIANPRPFYTLQEKAKNALEIMIPVWEEANDTIPSLLKSLTDPRGRIRCAAMEALERINPDWPQTEAAKTAVPSLIAALEYVDEGLGNELVELLTQIDPDWQESEAANKAIAIIFPKFLDQLKRHGSEENTALTLGRLGDIRAKDPLMKLRNDNTKSGLDLERLGVILPQHKRRNDVYKVALELIDSQKSIRSSMKILIESEKLNREKLKELEQPKGESETTKLIDDLIQAAYDYRSTDKALKELKDVLDSTPSIITIAKLYSILRFNNLVRYEYTRNQDGYGFIQPDHSYETGKGIKTIAFRELMNRAKSVC